MKLIKIMNNFHYLKLSDDITIFFSYETPIALSVKGKSYVAKNQWSKTTGKHINWYKQNIGTRYEEPEEVQHDELLFLINVHVIHS